MTNKKVNLNKKDIKIKKLQEKIKKLELELADKNTQFCELTAKHNVLKSKYAQSRELSIKLGKLYDLKTEEVETLQEFYQRASELKETND